MADELPASKIVIVEDDAALAEIYKTRLELIGYQCFVAADGIQALEVIEKIRPNLVLLDIMMPKLSGDVLLKTLRATDWGKNIRVMVISNLNEADAPAGIRDQGIEGYAVKANLADGEIDLLVDKILKPEGQTEDVNLDRPAAEPKTESKADTNPQVVSAPPDENTPAATPSQ